MLFVPECLADVGYAIFLDQYRCTLCCEMNSKADLVSCDSCEDYFCSDCDQGGICRDCREGVG